MENEKVVVLQLRLTRNRCLALLTLAFLCFHPHIAGSESLTLTTYYPAPYGGYVSLLTTNQTLLARDGGNVGVGTGSTSPAALLHVAGSGVRGGNVDFRVNGRMMTGDAGASGGMWMNGTSYSMFVGQNGTNAAIWTAGAGWSLQQAQNGDVSVGGNFTVGTNGGNYKVFGLCVQKTYAFNSTTPCPANHIPVAHWGDGTARTYGFLPAGPVTSTPYTAGTFIGLGQDFGGTMLCCRFNIP